jgi:ABC-type multidrug transport system fused ATPase/permease subunit
MVRVVLDTNVLISGVMVVIHNGKIIEQGTHTELLANQGMYYELYKTGFQE